MFNLVDCVTEGQMDPDTLNFILSTTLRMLLTNAAVWYVLRQEERGRGPNEQSLTYFISTYFKHMQVSVFAVDRGLIHEIAIAVNNKESMDQFKGRTTLRLIQSISTLPSAFPKALNVCGRICVHKSGRFVLVSNRGHESIAIFRVKKQDHTVGKLQAVGYFHTRGETPRHFDFDASGQFLIVANQDTSTISVFSFNLSSGEIKHTGNEYGVPSPNFVCCCPTREDCMLLLEGNDSEQSGTEVHIDLDADSDEGSTTACDTGKQMLYVELAVARKEIEDLKQKVADMASVA